MAHKFHTVVAIFTHLKHKYQTFASRISLFLDSLILNEIDEIFYNQTYHYWIVYASKRLLK